MWQYVDFPFVLFWCILSLSELSTFVKHQPHLIIICRNSAHSFNECLGKVVACFHLIGFGHRIDKSPAIYDDYSETSLFWLVHLLV